MADGEPGVGEPSVGEEPGVGLIANGRPHRAPAGTTVEAFVRSLGLDPRFVVVERNGEPLARERYGEVVLEDGDRLELVRAVAGG